MTTQWNDEPDWGALDSALAILRERPSDAIEEFKRLAELGSLLSMYYLAVVYTRGDGVPKDKDAAIYWHKRASDGGLARSKYYLGRHYLAHKRFSEALPLLADASDAGFVPATNMLGHMYFSGIGVDKDRERARTYWQTAVSGGHLLAKRDMAGAMITGAFGPNLIIGAIIRYLKAVKDILIEKKNDPNSDRTL